MAYKRPSDAMVAVPEVKRSRSELIAITNRDKALLEAVSVHCTNDHRFKPYSEPWQYFYFAFSGSSTHLKLAIAHHVARRPRRRDIFV